MAKVGPPQLRMHRTESVDHGVVIEAAGMTPPSPPRWPGIEDPVQAPDRGRRALQSVRAAMAMQQPMGHHAAPFHRPDSPS